MRSHPSVTFEQERSPPRYPGTDEEYAQLIDFIGKAWCWVMLSELEFRSLGAFVQHSPIIRGATCICALGLPFAISCSGVNAAECSERVAGYVAYSGSKLLVSKPTNKLRAHIAVIVTKRILCIS